MRFLALAMLLAAAPPQESAVRVAAFESDATPPLGHPLCGGWIKPVDGVHLPLLLKGVVLDDGRTRVVLASLDWCLLQTGAHDMFRGKIARAAGVPEIRASVHTTHTHGAPIADADAQRLLEKTPSPPAHLDLKFMEEVTDRAAAAVKEASGRLWPVTHVGRGRAKVEKFAGNRRLMVEGKIVTRYSAGAKDPAMREAPEGRIDPWLRTVTFFDGEKPLVRLHYYASHPQTITGDGKASPDVPGIARARIEKEEGIPHVYFTGCAGDVTAGKYNDGSRESQKAVADRLHAAMKESAAATEREPVSTLAWRTAEVRFAPRADPPLSETRQREVMASASAPPVQRLKAALWVAWYERLKTRPGVDLGLLQLGPVRILHLPGEAFIEYQLYAQGLRPEDFVAVAAYGESGPGYVCTDAAFTEGGYEPTMSRVGPPTEKLLKAGIAELLR